jgi:hypothetical protein
VFIQSTIGIYTKLCSLHQILNTFCKVSLSISCIKVVVCFQLLNILWFLRPYFLRIPKKDNLMGSNLEISGDIFIDHPLGGVEGPKARQPL